MSIHKAHALDRVAVRAQSYNQSLDNVIIERRALAEAMVEANAAKATQQEIADVTGDLDEDRLSRQRVKQLIDDFKAGEL